MDGIQAVQARIAEIQQAFAPPAPAAAATAPTDGSSDFASVLAGVTDGSPASATSSSFAPTADRTQWATDLLNRLGMPVTSENVKALAAWAQAEGTKAGFNPLATTQSMPGASSFNSVGVKNYASYTDGLQATVQTLTNGRYREHPGRAAGRQQFDRRRAGRGQLAVGHRPGRPAAFCRARTPV